MMKLLQQAHEICVYVYDETNAIKTGKLQWNLHFLRNFSFNRRRINQSKYQFGALGLLCQTATGWTLFPVWVKLICPQKIRDKSNAVLQRIISKLVPGLIIFDRGFVRRKVFETVLKYKHHILCRAKSNAVFYKIPKKRKRGRPKKYGDRINIRRLQYSVEEIASKTYSVASKKVRTRMCPADVRLVVIRTRPKKSKPYRYFLIFTTDMTLDISQIVIHYRHRWHIETAFRDVKQNFGFDKYQVKSRKSINRFVQLSFVAACFTKLVLTADPNPESMNVEDVCQALGIHWYRPERLTLGLCVAFLRLRITQTLFSVSSKHKTNSQNIAQGFRQISDIHSDKTT